MPVRFLMTCVIALFSLSSIAQVKKESVLIAAASDLKFALDSIIAAYKQGNPDLNIQAVYGSSGKLFEQIVNGAPFDIYFSADVEYPKKLAAKSLVISEVRTYGFGRIVLWSKSIDPSTEKMNVLLRKGIKKIAIANPLHAPYGKSAQQALEYFGMYEKVKTKLVFGENISQTAQFVTSGAADVGIIALSLALSPTMEKIGGAYYIIPPESYKPLEQAYVTLQHGKNNRAVNKFDTFIQLDTSRKIFQYFGFSTKQ